MPGHSYILYLFDSHAAKSRDVTLQRRTNLTTPCRLLTWCCTGSHSIRGGRVFFLLHPTGGRPTVSFVPTVFSLLTVGSDRPTVSSSTVSSSMVSSSLLMGGGKPTDTSRHIRETWKPWGVFISTKARSFEIKTCGGRLL